MKVVPLSRAAQAMKEQSAALERQRAQEPQVTVRYTLFRRQRTPAAAPDLAPLTSESFDTVDAAVAFLMLQEPTAVSQDGRHWWTETHDYVIHTQILTR